LIQAREKTHKHFDVDINDNEGVRFDIAVTTNKSTGSQIEGAAKTGFIEVI